MTGETKKSDPRQAVFRILEGVLEKNLPLDDCLEKEFTKAAGWSAQDRAFAKNLATTLFRTLALVDKEISGFLKRPLPPKALWVRHWLRIGAVQILFFEVPDHAAVNTTVEAVSRAKKPGAKVYKGLVNGILRNIIRTKDAALKRFQEAPEAILPRWLRQRWEEFYGVPTVRAISQVLASQPPLDLTLKDPAQTFGLEGTEIFEGVIRLSPKGLITDLPGFKEGGWWAQDIAAGLPPRLLGDVKGKAVLDLCAAPGGKTLFLAASGAKVTAVDASAERLKRLAENLQRTGLAAKVICADVLAFRPGEKFDCILLDAPCSATGTLRRHPDVPYHRGKTEIERLAGLQVRLLSHAAGLLKPGGVLVYCVCSLEKEEGEDVITRFLSNNPTLKRDPLKARELAGHSEWITKDGDLRTLPSHLAERGGMDGFFAARLIKA